MDILGGLESGEKYRLAVPGLPYGIEIPYIRVPGSKGDLKIASLNLVGQIRLNQDLGRLLAERIKAELLDLRGITVLTAVEKALMLTQVTARELGLEAVAVAYNRVKPHMEPERRPVVQAGVDSITSGDKFLAVYERDINLLMNAPRGVIIIDDVVSTGGTVLGLANLLEEVSIFRGTAQPEILGIFCVAQEGGTHPFLPAPLYSLCCLPEPVVI